MSSSIEAEVEVVENERQIDEDDNSMEADESHQEDQRENRRSLGAGNLPRPDPVNDDPADFIDVVATDSPVKINNGNLIRVISAVPPSSNIDHVEDNDEKEIVEGLRKSKEPPQRIIRRIFVRRNEDGRIMLDKNNVDNRSLAISTSPAGSFIKQTQPVSLAELPIVTDEECIRATEATKEFASKLKSLKLSPKQKEDVMKHVGTLVDTLVSITKESKDREIQQKLEDDRLWLRNEIDSIIEKRLGAIRVNANRQFWRNEAEKFTEMALTNLMVYRENGTRKQDVLTSALAGFNMAYIQTHKYGIEIISTIKKMRSKFTENARACRAFVDVCADFLMNNCFEKHFPCNAEKYALLRHVEQLFDIKLDYKFFTLENGTGKLDRRIRTIRTTDYKKGGKIQRKRKPLSNHIKREPKQESVSDESKQDSDLSSTKSPSKSESKLGQKRSLPTPQQRRTWTRPSLNGQLGDSPSTSVIQTRMSKRIRFSATGDKKLVVLSKSNIDDLDETSSGVEEVRGHLIDTVNEVELPNDEEY
ncbi:hypothetical protein M3Y97_00167100 [Aphelenchoides bicaudatus]|nr:hypothetical protein M3Y97_00167100 [Aphelenchoides bicaudatus]